MDERVMAVGCEDTGMEYSWWVGDGRWWLMVEGFGMVAVYDVEEKS